MVTSKDGDMDCRYVTKYMDEIKNKRERERERKDMGEVRGKIKNKRWDNCREWSLGFCFYLFIYFGCLH